MDQVANAEMECSLSKTQALCTFPYSLVFVLAKIKQASSIDAPQRSFGNSVSHLNHYRAPTTALKIQVLTFLDLSTTLDTPAVITLSRAVDYTPTSSPPIEGTYCLPRKTKVLLQAQFRETSATSIFVNSTLCHFNRTLRQNILCQRSRRI